MNFADHFSRPARRRTAGWMMAEALVYAAVLIFVVGVAFACFYRVWDNTRRLARNAADIAGVLRAGERWRADVRSAAGAPRVEAAAGRTVFHLATTNGAVRYVFADGRMIREQQPPGRADVLLPKVKTSRMVFERRQHAVCWRWELELAGKQEAARVIPRFTFQAVPAPHAEP